MLGSILGEMICILLCSPDLLWLCFDLFCGSHPASWCFSNSLGQVCTIIKWQLSCWGQVEPNSVGSMTVLHLTWGGLSYFWTWESRLWYNHFTVKIPCDREWGGYVCCRKLKNWSARGRNIQPSWRRSGVLMGTWGQVSNMLRCRSHWLILQILHRLLDTI